MDDLLLVCWTDDPGLSPKDNGEDSLQGHRPLERSLGRWVENGWKERIFVMWWQQCLKLITTDPMGNDEDFSLALVTGIWRRKPILVCYGGGNQVPQTRLLTQKKCHVF